ncbi:MAG: pyrroline-5-carboxylate reductase [Pseudomonadaceae bacterium]|nr:pyrroline-5-carboxylate reductase [Pseudomonadaceae bacterium]
MTAQTIAFIGAGNMARSLMAGLRTSRPQDVLIAADPSAEQTELAANLGVSIAADNEAAARQADVVVLAVKPQIMAKAAAGTAPGLSERSLVISVAAGIEVATLRQLLGSGPAIVRCMPNTPALYGQGMSGLFASDNTRAEQKDQAQSILAAVGDTLWVARESQLDAVTAVSGSGPAYFFLLMEHMINAGIELGLDEATATTLTLQTAQGAAAMAIAERESMLAGGGGSDVATLRRNVTSPGGTTQAALETMLDGHMPETVNRALKAAAVRSAELAKEFAGD